MTDVWAAFIEARLATAGEFLRVARAILDLHRVESVGHIDVGRPVWNEDECHSCGNLLGNTACETVRALAAAWSDHPDYPGAHQIPHSVV